MSFFVLSISRFAQRNGSIVSASGVSMSVGKKPFCLKSNVQTKRKYYAYGSFLFPFLPRLRKGHEKLIFSRNGQVVT
jgi:hypothetical protein